MHAPLDSMLLLCCREVPGQQAAGAAAAGAAGGAAMEAGQAAVAAPAGVSDLGWSVTSPNGSMLLMLSCCVCVFCCAPLCVWMCLQCAVCCGSCDVVHNPQATAARSTAADTDTVQAHATQLDVHC
jgi:hypothetical protein